MENKLCLLGHSMQTQSYNEERNVALNLHLDEKLWFLKVNKA